MQSPDRVHTHRNHRAPVDRRRVVFATVVGTTVEWYDFFIYATAVGLVFGELFFAPAGSQFGAILAFLTVGISFLFRPLGAFLAGHFGDKYGRKVVLMWTLILMGVATALIGLLPTYEADRDLGARSCWSCCASCRASRPAASGAVRF